MSEFLDELFGPEAEAVKKRLLAGNKDRATIVECVRFFLKNPAGLEFLYWIINQTGVFALSFTGNSNTYFLEGRRSIGLELYRLLMEADPQALQTMIDYRMNRKPETEEGENHG